MLEGLNTSAFLRRAGRSVTLRRLPAVDITVSASIRFYTPEELGEGIINGDRLMIIGNGEIELNSWPGPPQRNDRVIDGGHTYNIEYVDTLYAGSAIKLHRITLRG